MTTGTETSGTADPAGWLTDLFGGMITETGIRVSVTDALTVPGVAASVQVQADDLAKVPVYLHRRLPNGGSERATDHPLYALLVGWPAPWLSSFNWRRTLIHNAITRGNGFSRARWSAEGIVERITNIQPGRITTRWTDDGEPYFDLSGHTYERGLSWRDIIHVPYRASSDKAENGGVFGISPIEQHKEMIALCIATERFAAKFFKNGARPSAVIEMDGKLPNDQVAARIRASLERTYAGVDNAFKIAILELGMKLKEFSFSNADSQLIEIRKEQAVQCAQAFGVPPHKIGILDRATFSNIEHQAIEYVTGPLSALAEAMESAIETTSLSVAERGRYFVEVDLDGLKRGDILTRYRAYAIGRQWGWLSADEIREWERQNPLPDGQGKEFLKPLNMIPAGQDPTKDDPADKPAAPNKD
ncbi:phage portal protein [Azospirillum canadense]|uniref:phage portal protein n=1 Tax=Azospirillum canadense TaxID=403962 RepID=UPI00222692C3|nr:phage portal protein [Azospirillum canadense]MCW2243587.1 HK97 family phage portal protein [Azospirillum canadense]